MKSEFARIKEKAYNILNAEEYKEMYRISKKDFSRNRKLRFSEICMLIIKGFKNGLQTGINTFLSESSNNINSYSKAAFTKARQKIHPDAFRALIEMTVDDFYNQEKPQKYKGYRIFAIDGSDFNLPNTAELLDFFVSETFGDKTQMQAQASCLYDVLNNIIVDARLEPFNTSKRTLAEEHIEVLSKIKTEKDLILMDRGYPSEKLLLSLSENNLFYVIRSNKEEFFREIRRIKGIDETVVRKCKNNKELKIRVITLTLPNGVKETLITNIFDESIKPEEFSELYSLRWGIETKYDERKNKLCIENFTGVLPVCILQDFYAVVFLSNLVTYLELDCSKEIKVINSSEELKYQYKVNTALAIATLKTNVVKLFMTKSKRQFNKIYNQIHKELLMCLTPIRPGRSNPRRKAHNALKFHQNNKLS